MYNKEKGQILLPSETSFGDQELKERYDIQERVKEYPILLGIGDLLIITTEFSGWDKTNERLDLLALDRDGKLVVIELKRDDSGKDVVLQAIKYAAYCSTLTLEQVATLHYKYINKLAQGAVVEQALIDQEVENITNFITKTPFVGIDDKPRIILISKEFRPEVTHPVLWLNREYKMEITCVKLTPYDIGENKLGVVSTVIIPVAEEKEYMIEMEKKDQEEGKIIEHQKDYIDFFSDVKARYDVIAKNKFSSTEPIGDKFYIIPTTIENIYFKWIFRSHQRRYFHIELCLENNDKALQEAIIGLKSEFKNKMEKPVHINMNVGPSNPIPKVYFAYPFEGKPNDVPLEFTDEEFKKWIVEQSDIFFGLVKPILDKFTK